MHFLAHLSYPYLVANGVALAFGKVIPLEYNILLIFFSILPDVDQFYDYFEQIITTDKYKVPATHHENVTHWPIIYTPLIAISIITQNPYFITITGAIYAHLIMDSFLCNQGVRWFYPFSNKWFNFFAKKTNNKWGIDWNKAYDKLLISSVDKIAFVVLLIHAFIIILI